MAGGEFGDEAALFIEHPSRGCKGVVSNGHAPARQPDSTPLQRGHAALPVATLCVTTTSPLTVRLSRWPWSVLKAGAMSIITLVVVFDKLVERDRYGHTLRALRVT